MPAQTAKHAEPTTCPRCGAYDKDHDARPRCRYNGWTNYETWCAKLWLDNEEGSYNYWHEQAKEIAETASEQNTVAVWTSKEYARFTLANLLKEKITEANPLASQASMFSDLMGAALSEVNWTEIAENLLED